MKYKKSIFIGIVILFGGVAIVSWRYYDDQKHSLENLGFSISEREKFSVEERFQPHFSDYEEESIFANKDQSILRLAVLSHMTTELASKYTTSQFSVFESMFDKKLPPYPELITNATGCDDEFLPQKKKTLLGDYYTIYAGDRLNFGICDQSTAKYKAGIGIFYCEKLQKVVKMSYFIDKSESFDTIDTLMNSFICLDN